MRALQSIHIVQGQAPVADAFAGTKRTDVVDASGHHRVYFVIQKGVGTTGTTKLTVEASDNVTPSTVAAIPFRYRVCVATDVWGEWTETTAADGYTTAAGSAHMIQIEVDTVELAKVGYQFVSLKAVEVVDDPVLAGILIILAEPRVAQSVTPTVLT